MRPGIHPPFYASSGVPEITTASLQEDVYDLPKQGSFIQVEELHWEEMYHKRRLLFAVNDAIINQVSPEVQQWPNGGPKSRRTVEISPSDRPQTQANSRFLQEIASSSLRP